jgi:putative ABC transport system permease protein
MRLMRWFATLSLCFKSLLQSTRVEEELEEELQFHLDQKTEELIRAGVPPARAREIALRTIGGMDRQKERCREARAGYSLDLLRADFVFGWRQLKKRKVSTATAVLSLGLAIGGCMSAFRLVDALFLRSMPISHPERVYGVFRYGKGFSDGKPQVQTSYEYPVFQQMRAAVRKEAEVIAVSYASRTDVSFRAGQNIEKAELQYVSGTMFGTFGLRPAAGRLLTESDDTTPGAHPYAALSYDYWTHRFGKDPGVIGRSVSIGERPYEIVGVAPKGFMGTEPGTPVDIFLPAMMNPGVVHPDWGWIRILIALKPGVSVEPVQEKLRAVFEALQRERTREFSGRPKQFIERFLSWQVRLRHAPAGISNMQSDYRLPLLALSALLGLILLIACVNEANQMSVQSASRSAEMALRFSLGADRGRLVRMVLAESAMMGAMASGFGVLFSLWATPFLISRIQTADFPVRLSLESDWKVASFAIAVAVAVTLMFGLIPAIRTSEVSPLSALKGNAQPQKRRRWMLAPLGVQAAFCFVVLFHAGLLVATFEKLTQQSLGFSPDGLLLVNVAAERAQEPAVWDQAADSLQTVPGVLDVAQAEWPLLSGNTENSFIAVNGEVSPEEASTLSVSPGWSRVMKIPLLAGRDFRVDDTSVNVALVNETFADEYFGSRDPIGRRFAIQGRAGTIQVVGVLGNARYQNVREGARPLFYMPIHQTDPKGGFVPLREETLTVRTAVGDPLAISEMLRKTLAMTHPELRIENLRTQQELMDGQSVRERLLAMLAAFFATVAPLLAGMGLYGVLSYSVLLREREFGIRIAVGAPARSIAQLVTADVLAVVSVGAAMGAVLAAASVRYIAPLLFAVSGRDPRMFAMPAVVLFAAAALAALTPVMRAASIDPAIMLRSEL